MEHTHSDSNCCSGSSSSSVRQSLDEMDFDRGLWSAALYGDLEKVQKLLLRDPHSVNRKDKSGYAALHYAARSGHEAVCRELISAGADVNVVLRSGDTALHRSAFGGHTRVVKLLLDSGAQPSAGDLGKTPLHKAVEQKKVDVSRLLIEKYPQLLSVRDIQGKTVSDYLDMDTAESTKWRQLLSS